MLFRSTDDVGVTRLRVTYTDPDNPSRIINVDQDLNVAKRRPGASSPLVQVTASSQAFIKPKNGGIITPSSVTLTATTANIADTKYYRWYINDQLVQGHPVGQTSGGTNSGTFTLNSFSDVKYKTVKVMVTSSASNTINVFDSISIFYIEDGSDSLQAALTNENQTVVLDAAGTAISGLPGTSTMAVFRGTIRLLSNVVYSLVDQDGFRDTTDNSVDISINSSTGVITFTGVYDTSAFATFRATVTNPDGTTVELDKTLTVSRVQDGQPADPTVIIDLKSESDVVAAQNNGTGYDLTGLDNQIYLYKADTIVSSDDVVFGIQGIPSGTGTTVEKTISGLKFTVTKATGVVVIASTNLDSWTTDQVVITFTATYNGTTYSQQYTLAKSRAGTDSVHVDLKSESDVVASKSDGTGYDLTDIQNEIRLYKGGEKLTNGVTYGPASTTKNGLTVSVNTTTGAFTLSGTNWNTNQEFFIINATYNSKTYSKTYSITKGRQGISATLIQLTNDSHIIQADESGSAYNYDGANTTASIIIGGDDDSNNWTWTAPTIPSGLTASITNSNRTVTITSSTTTFRSGTITFTATRTGYSTQTAVFSITKNNDGANAVIIDLTNDSHNIQANKDGVAYNHTGATTTATVKKGGQDDSNNWTWTAPTIPSGLTATISSDNRTVTITDSATTFRSGTITFTATRTGYATQIAVFSITKTKDGLTGQVIVDSYIFKRSASQPPTPSGGDFANPVPSGWSDGIPADDQYGNPVWFSHRKFTSDGLTPQAAAWSTPQKVLQPSTSIRYVFSETEPPGTAPVDGLPSSGWSFTPTTNTIYVQVQKSVNNGLNWTNEGVPIKIKGETGLKGLNTLIAYAKVGQNQSAPAIQSTTTYPTLPNTSGSTVWQSTAPTATVGEVIWYSYGKYNPNSSGTIDGVAAGQIVWSTPIAASVFQDIRSDNWQASTGFNGSTPTGGIFTSATGYYLNKTEGSLYATNVFLRGTASFDSFQTKGETSALLTTTTRTINNQSYNKIATTAASTYSFGSTITNAGQYIRSAQFLETNKDTGCIFNVGLLISALGSAGLSTGQDVGIISTSSFFGGFFETTSNLGAGLIAKTTFSNSPGNGNKDNGGYALWVEGNIRWGSVVWETPPNDTSKFLCSNGTWGAPSLGNSVTGNLYVSGDIFAFTSSDISLKRNLSTIKNPLEKLHSIRGYNFNWSSNYLASLPENFIKSKDIGLIAQEVEKYIPEAVITRENGIKAVNYQKLIPLIIEAIIELNNKLNKDK